MPKQKIIKLIRYTARTILTVVAVFWFLFALVSGSEGFGGGLKGIIINSPNAIPWVFLLVFVYIAWRWEMIGGSVIVLMGVFTVFMFNTYRDLLTFFTISIPLIVLGGMFILTSKLDKSKK